MKKKEKGNNNINIKRIIIIGLIIIVLGLFLIIIVGIELSKREKEIVLNKKTDIEIGGYNQVITVKSILKNVTIMDEKYIKIYLNIENKKNIDSITALHQFKLVDKSNKELTSCYHEGILPNSSYTDIFPKKIEANKVTSGYLYCPTDLNNFSKLKITVIAGGNIDSNSNITYEYRDYYVDLNK